MYFLPNGFYNNSMHKIIKTFLLGVMAGAAIALGGLLFTLLSKIGYKVIGSFAFSIGLLLVCMFGFNLFTGKVGFFLEAENKKEYSLNLLIMYIGNFVGALVIGCLCYGFYSKSESMVSSYTVFDAIVDIARAREITSDNWWITLLGAIGCGMLVYTAVYAFKKEWPIGIRVVVLMFAVFAFVLAGFQHCIANMFYISFAMGWNGSTLLNVLIVTIGNIIGAILLELVSIAVKKLSNEENKKLSNEEKDHE